MKWEIEHYDRERMAPGYLFVAPYGQISPEHPTQKYQQYQVGPYIYDDSGVCGESPDAKKPALTRSCIDADLGRLPHVR